MSLFRTTFPSSGEFGPLFRLLDDYDSHRSTRQQSSPSLRSFSPRFDVRESEDAYYLDGELPGIAQKDIDIEFADPQTLVVKGRTEREYQTGPNKDAEGATNDTEQTPTTAHRFWASERSVGEFQRTFAFPARVNQDAVKASLKNGILSIIVPKATAVASKKITVE